MIVNEIFINNEHFVEMMNIINTARLNPPKEGHIHHIIPRCWFKLKNLDVDNSDKNLVLLSYDAHVKVHELAYHCSTGTMKRNMAYAYSFLSKGKILSNDYYKGENNPFFGKTHTDETRKKLSESRKGIVFSDEARRKISEALKGKPSWNKGITHSDVHCKNISESLKGRTYSDEHCKNISESLKGKVFSDEHKRKISESSKGRTHSDETREKISESLKDRVFSDESRRKMSESKKGKTWKLIDGKRVWLSKE